MTNFENALEQVKTGQKSYFRTAHGNNVFIRHLTYRDGTPKGFSYEYMTGDITVDINEEQAKYMIDSYLLKD